MAFPALTQSWPLRPLSRTLAWHSLWYFLVWSGIISAVEAFFLDYARGPLINLHAWWAVEKVLQASTQNCHTCPPVFSPGLCLSSGPSFLPCMPPSLCISFP